MRTHTFALSAALAATCLGHAFAQDTPTSDMLGASEGLQIPDDVSLI